MDVTAFFAHLDWGPFTQVSLFFQNYAYSLVAILSLALAPYLRKRGRYYALAVSMVLIIVLSFLLKDAYFIPRPCNDWLLDAKACTPQGDYGFPSGHTAFAFVFVAAALGTRIFPFFLATGIIIGLSRVYLGIHSIGDVAGGAALGVLAYLFVEEIVDWAGRKQELQTRLGGSGVRLRKTHKKGKHRG